jgi:hypothetical protein
MLTVPIEQKHPKSDLNETNELTQPEETFTESFINDIKTEIITNLNDDQVVIPNDDIQPNKIFKRRMMMNLNCQNCQQKFKTKTQLNAHLIKCQYESEQK